MLRNRRLLSCHYCGKRSDTYFNRNSTRQFDCKFCLATNHLDQNGDITNPPVAKVNAASSSLPRYAPRPNVIRPSTIQPEPESLFCEACLKHQRLFVASIAQYEAESEKDDFALDKDYYRYRRNLVNRYPQCCEQCKPRVEAAIKKADYQAKTDHLRRMADKSRDPRRTTRRRSGLDLLDGVGKLLWVLAVLLQLAWHLTAFVGLASTDESGMKDPDDDSWTTKGLQRLDTILQQGPGDDLLWWSLLASAASIWWNPEIAQVIRGFDRHLIGFKSWYATQAFLAIMRFGLHSFDLGAQSWSAQLAMHLICTVLTLRAATKSRSLIKTDSSSLFGSTSGVLPTPDPSKEASETPTLLQKQPARQPTMSEAFNDALGGSPQRLVGSDESERTYPYHFIPQSNAMQQQAVPEEDEMEWQPTGSTTLPRALRNPNLGAGNRPFGQAPVQENSRPFYYRAPNAPTNPSSEARNGPKTPVIWGSQRRQEGFEPKPATKSQLEFQPPKFFAQQPAPDRQDDELLSGLAGGLSFDERNSPKKGGWFGFGK